MKQVITVTDRAAEHAKALIEKANDPEILGLRIGIKSKGCSGQSYHVEYAKTHKKFEDVVEHQGIKFYIDPAATMYLLGSKMDYVSDKLSSTFTFDNPNAKGQCGCGESFHF